MKRLLCLLLLCCLHSACALADEETYFVFAGGAQAEAAAPSGPPAAVGTLMLVNDSHLLDEDYAPRDLVKMIDYCDADIIKIKGNDIHGEREAVNALLVMVAVARGEGIGPWQVSSGYRSIAYQQKMWDNKVYEYRQEGKSGSQARAAAGRYMARPGASEHHTGLAFDITVPGEDSFVSTKQSKWLSENCWDYGFIIRYTAEKQPITGINAEPWHIRYVGLPYSQEMRDSGECLEEYLGLVD